MRRRGEMRGRRSVAGATLLETLAALWVFGLLTTLLLALSSAANRAADHRLIQETLRARARTSLDEILREVRAADRVLPSRVISSQTVTSGAANVVLQASGYNPAQAGVAALLNVKDVIAFRHDATAGTLSETTVVNAASSRPRRTALTFAQRVQSIAYTYYVRDRFAADGIALAYTLHAKPSAAPTAYVNGVAVTSAWVAGTSTLTLAAKPAAGADIQIVYSVDPAANSGAALAWVSRVNIVVTLSQTDGRGVARTVTLAGSALLRNYRS